VEADAFYVAIKAACRLSKHGFFPSPSEVQAQLDQAQEAKLGENPSADEAWQIVRMAARFIGSQKDDCMARIESNSACASALRRIGGLGRVEMADLEYEIKHLEKSFRLSYEAYLKHERAESVLGVEGPSQFEKSLLSQVKKQIGVTNA
jgi:hypothetical protein